MLTLFFDPTFYTFPLLGAFYDDHKTLSILAVILGAFLTLGGIFAIPSSLSLPSRRCSFSTVSLLLLLLGAIASSSTLGATAFAVSPLTHPSAGSKTPSASTDSSIITTLQVLVDNACSLPGGRETCKDMATAVLRAGGEEAANAMMNDHTEEERVINQHVNEDPTITESVRRGVTEMISDNMRLIGMTIYSIVLTYVILLVGYLFLCLTLFFIFGALLLMINACCLKSSSPQLQHQRSRRRRLPQTAI